MQITTCIKIGYCVILPAIRNTGGLTSIRKAVQNLLAAGFPNQMGPFQREPQTCVPGQYGKLMTGWNEGSIHGR
jgi:hypothetical protein